LDGDTRPDRTRLFLSLCPPERPSRSRFLKGADLMDLNYLYHRRGKSLMMAALATCEASRTAHLALANGYVAKIAEMRGAQRVRALAWMPESPAAASQPLRRLATPLPISSARVPAV
jgi:hypothetical protein